MAIPDRSIDPRLLASAKAEFMKHGYLKAELKTICENAEITTGAVYKRYKGKEDLFNAVVEDIAAELNNFVENRSDLDFTVIVTRFLCLSTRRQAHVTRILTMNMSRK